MSSRNSNSSPKANVDLKECAGIVYRNLSKQYPDAHCTVDLKTPEQFLFANILSPQCTDIVTNKVMEKLWGHFGSAEAVAQAPVEEIEEIIRPCGMYRVKSKNILASAKLLVKKYGGKLPKTLDELMEFPGIGRKTGQVIMLEVYGECDGIIVDTHNIRVAHRIGLTSAKDAVNIEKDLMKIVPKEYWRMWSHLMVFHGRALCPARSPKCNECPIREVCEYGMRNG